MMNKKVQRGDIVLANIKNVDGSVQKNKRVFCIVSNNKANNNSPVVTAVALSARVNKKRYLPTHKSVPLQSMERYEDESVEFELKDSIALCEQIFSLDYCQLDSRVAAIKDDKVLEDITEGIKVQVGIYPAYN